MILNIDDIEQFDVEKFGNKALGIFYLKKAHFNIPKTFLIPVNYFPNEIEIEYIFKIFNSEKIIVRSSTNLEDSREASYAGVFLSKSAFKSNTSEVIKTIRNHAKEQLGKILDFENKNISLIIQPFFEGFGGVYLSNKSNSFEKLEISNNGVSEITEGIVNENCIIQTDTLLYKNVINTCRIAQKKLKSSVDFEFTLVNDEVVFLQYRQLSKQAEKQTLHYTERSEYFPLPIRRLCASTWIKNLNKVLDIELIYKGNYIEYFPSLSENSLPNIDDKQIQSAIQYYKNILFPRWDFQLLQVENLIEEPEKKFILIYNIWSNFIEEYFNNKYEYIIDYARGQSPKGASFSPKFCTWLNDTNNIITNYKANNYKNQETFSVYIDKYGKTFLPNSNYFEEFSLEEKFKSVGIDSLLHIFKSNSFNESNYFPINNPTSILEAAWLADEDNEYKGLFSYYLRIALIDLANLWYSQKKIEKSDDIWDLDIDNILNFIDKKTNYLSTIQKDLTIDIDREISDTLDAEILSNIGLTIKGYAIIDEEENTDMSNKILVKKHINTWDYPTLLNCAGVIVEIGSYNAHSAIFSRDINKPLFKSPHALKKIKNGTYIELNHLLNKIIIIN